MEFKKAYEPKIRQSIDCSGESRTQQQYKDLCDVNNICRKYAQTGLLEHVNKYQGIYDDVSNAEDYRASMETVLRANDMFMSLSSDIRKRFENDPAKFLQFAENKDNIDEMREMGLLPPVRPLKEQIKAESVSDFANEDSANTVAT